MWLLFLQLTFPYFHHFATFVFRYTKLRIFFLIQNADKTTVSFSVPGAMRTHLLFHFYFRFFAGRIAILALLFSFQVQGAIILAALLQVAVGISGILGPMLRFIGPLTIAPTITLIGLSLFEAAPAFCSKHWGIALLYVQYITGPILGLRPANERRCYFVTTSLIGWAQA